MFNLRLSTTLWFPLNYWEGSPVQVWCNYRERTFRKEDSGFCQTFSCRMYERPIRILKKQAHWSHMKAKWFKNIAGGGMIKLYWDFARSHNTCLSACWIWSLILSPSSKLKPYISVNSTRQQVPRYSSPFNAVNLNMLSALKYRQQV